MPILTGRKTSSSQPSAGIPPAALPAATSGYPLGRATPDGMRTTPPTSARETPAEPKMAVRTVAPTDVAKVARRLALTFNGPHSSRHEQNLWLTCPTDPFRAWGKALVRRVKNPFPELGSSLQSEFRNCNCHCNIQHRRKEASAIIFGNNWWILNHTLLFRSLCSEPFLMKLGQPYLVLGMEVTSAAYKADALTSVLSLLP